MPVNKEELVKDLDSPEYQTLIQETLAKKEFVVQSKADHTAYLDRYKNTVIEKELPAKLSEIYNALDKDVKDTFGLDKLENEKTYDYIKRAGKTATGDVKKHADKIKELEDAIASGKGSEAMRQRLEEEEASFKRALADKNREINELKASQSRTQKSADVKLLYGEIKKGFIKALPPLFSHSESAILNDAIANSVAKDGKLYMTNADGSIRKDSSYNEISVEDYLKDAFKEVIDKKKTQGGAGSTGGEGDDGKPDPTKITVENFPMKQDIKTKGALMDYMSSIGLIQGSALWNHIYKKYGLSLEA